MADTAHDLEHTAFSRVPQSASINQTIVIGLIGGPGSGKGTQCSLLRRDLEFEHSSIGDVLREEMARPGSPFQEEIREHHMLGRVGRKELTVGFLRDRIDRAAERGDHKVVIDGLLISRV